jgi:hypothetical protein
MVNHDEFEAALRERFESAIARLAAADKELDEAQRHHEYWTKLTAAYKLVIAHEEWLEKNEAGT